MLGDKVWLNNKYIITRNRNCKLEAKFFISFRVLYPISDRKTGLQIITIKDIENPQCFSHITAWIKHYKEKMSGWNNIFNRIWK